MAHESFENEETAAIMNREFVNIKVDREERPDVDRVYMTFVQATTGGGGWPMSVWLTPDLKPFVGGTYFPPEDRYGQPGFQKVLERIATAWKEDHDKIAEQGKRLSMRCANRRRTARVEGKIDAAVFERRSSNLIGASIRAKAASALRRNFRVRSRSIFSRDFTRAIRKATRASRRLEMDLFTLRKMAAGGMHDHLGGGFHRYSVDRYWHVPHFEKMLYDQAQLALAYLDAFQITQRAAICEAVRAIFSITSLAT